MADTPYVPEYITVHLGPPNLPAPNVTVSFPDYIKNVSSSEIYPTWPISALRANIFAQISFALNRVFTEYYRSRGYDFNITNDTSIDQNFVAGRAFYDSVSQITDEIFNDYIRREGFIEPLYAQYCNGTTVTCEGLSQWGSVDLANSGYNSIEILKYYYGDDIELVVDAPVQGITSSVPGRLLRLGSVGNDVTDIQARLNRISLNYPSIPKIADVTGYFGVETNDAVREFQRIFNLAIDGIVGKDTWYSIQLVYASVKKLNELHSEGITYGDLSKNFSEELSLGDEGMDVSPTQYMLKYIAQYEETVPPLEITGVFDNTTQASVIGFQKTYGLPPTGVVNDVTYDRMFDVYHTLISSLPDSLFENTARPHPGAFLSIGQSGQYVTYLQEYLTAISNIFPYVPAPEIDGTFGPQTEEAVRAVQSIAGLEVNGIVGTFTWDAIGELYNDIMSGNIVKPDQYPGYIID